MHRVGQLIFYNANTSTVLSLGPFQLPKKSKKTENPMTDDARLAYLR
jgi:hypothetical protein